MKIFLIIVSILSLPVLSYSQNKNPDWILAGTSSNGGKSFIKSSGAIKSGNIIRFWYKDVNEKVDSIIKVQFTTLFFVEVDCVATTMALIKGSVIDLKERQIFEQQYHGSPEKVKQGSMSELIMKKACLIFNK